MHVALPGILQMGEFRSLRFKFAKGSKSIPLWSDLPIHDEGRVTAIQDRKHLADTVLTADSDLTHTRGEETSN